MSGAPSWRSVRQGRQIDEYVMGPRGSVLGSELVRYHYRVYRGDGGWVTVHEPDGRNGRRIRIGTFWTPVIAKNAAVLDSEERYRHRFDRTRKPKERGLTRAERTRLEESVAKTRAAGKRLGLSSERIEQEVEKERTDFARGMARHKQIASENRERALRQMVGASEAEWHVLAQVIRYTKKKHEDMPLAALRNPGTSAPMSEVVRALDQRGMVRFTGTHVAPTSAGFFVIPRPRKRKKGRPTVASAREQTRGESSTLRASIRRDS